MNSGQAKAWTQIKFNSHTHLFIALGDTIKRDNLCPLIDFELT